MPWTIYHHQPKPSTKSSTDKELAHNRERGNSNWFKLCKGILLYPHDVRTMRLTQRAKLDKGVLASIVPNKPQPFNITPSLRGESPRSIGDTPKPLYTAPWPRIWDRASTIKSKKVIGSSVPLFGYVVAWKCAQSWWHPRTVLKRFKRTMPKGLLL